MSTKTKQYAIQSLAACGFAVMRSTVAYRLRPDLWSSAEECGNDFRSKSVDSVLEGVQRLNVVFDGSDEVMKVLSRSLNRLAERIEWIAGYKVLKIEAEQPTAPVVKAKPQPTQAELKAAANLEELKRLAALDPQPQDCHYNREIFRARRELEAMGIKAA